MKERRGLIQAKLCQLTYYPFKCTAVLRKNVRTPFLSQTVVCLARLYL